MSAENTRTISIAIISLIFVFVVHRLGRKQRLSFRYTVGWLSIGVMGAIAGILLPISEPVARFLKVSPGSFLAAGAVLLLVALCVQLSISISGLQEQIRRLAEEVAFVRQELEEQSQENLSHD